MADTHAAHTHEADAFHEPPEGPLAFSDMPHEGSPTTPNAVRPDRVFERKMFGDKLTLPDGRRVDYWCFEDESGRRDFPGPLIRVREGEVVHTIVRAEKNTHTIHHHGIQPGPHDDGVGHTSFEVNGRYAYQWRPAPGHAGSYWYHCHVNTTLHVEMGMYGPLIVDPPEGPGTLFSGGRHAYDVERYWISGGIDPSKHDLNHAAGLDGENVRLNLWDPRYFHVNGAFHPTARTSPRSAVSARSGQTILLRILNAGYFPQKVSFGGLAAQFVGSDGRPLPAPFTAREYLLGSAERYDVLLRPPAGVHRVRFEHQHWITRRVVGVCEADIRVT